MDAKNTKNRRLKIDEEYYNSILSMIESPDDENLKLSFQIIENMDYEDNFIYILFLYRACTTQTRKLWAEIAPNSAKFCEDLKVKHSLNVIGLHATLKGKVSKQQEEFVNRQFGQTLMKTLRNYGYEFIENIDLKIKW